VLFQLFHPEGRVFDLYCKCFSKEKQKYEIPCPCVTNSSCFVMFTWSWCEENRLVFLSLQISPLYGLYLSYSTRQSRCNRMDVADISHYADTRSRTHVHTSGVSLIMFPLHPFSSFSAQQQIVDGTFFFLSSQTRHNITTCPTGHLLGILRRKKGRIVQGPM
jgi:hypothetical protein